MSKEISVEKERYFSAHHTLMRCAKHSLQKAEEKADGWADEEFIAVTLSALAIEAIYNAVGSRCIEGWGDYESCNPKAKLRIICQHLSIPFNAGHEPWTSLLWLQKFRNEVAHPKPEPISQKLSIPHDEFDISHVHEPPKSKLEQKITLQNAKKAVQSVQKTLDIIAEKLPEEIRCDITMDHWESTTTPSQIHRRKPLN